MSELESSSTTTLNHTLRLDPSEPLWKRVPTRDEDGRYLSDFMMFIPRLNKREKHYISGTINKLSCVLERYNHVVVFADLNIKMNVLWVSIRPVKGMCVELPAAIRSAVPEAVLVAEKHEA